ncbi:MAG: hypothetical protein MMC23_003835 [Stictis urceolatum]|nr:hypothetical protein [Stictis urceolata]
MASHNVNSALLDELITATTGLDPYSKGNYFEKVRRTATSILKDSKAGRTNQFAVKDQYQGLEERAVVFSYDELADALHSAWEDLARQQHKLTPELVSLLLHLANDPVNKTSLDNLDVTGPPSSPPPLTWDDILKDDPIGDEAGIWENIDYAEESSLEGSELSEDCLPIKEASLAPIAESETEKHGYIEALEAMKLTPDFAAIQSLKALHQRSTTQSEDKIAYSETRIIRETIFMLIGLPCDVYSLTTSGRIEPNPQIDLDGVSSQALGDILARFASIGTSVQEIRTWTETSRDIQFVQAFQSSLRKMLHAVNLELHQLERRIIHADGEPITLLSVMEEFKSMFKCVLPLEDVVKQHLQHYEGRPFIILENLFTMACTHQLIGETELCNSMVSVFSDSMRAYSKTLKLWMTIGDVGMNSALFFVRESETPEPLQKLWSDQFSLVRNADGALFAPNFLHIAAKRIFTTGKSVRFLKALGEHIEENSHSSSGLNIYDAIKDDLLRLLPVDELFNDVFNSWIASLHQSSSQRLQAVLKDRCGLLRHIDGLEAVYFGSNGAVSDEAFGPFFERMDGGFRDWNNSFLLTSRFRNAFGQLEFLDASRITVKVLKDDQAKSSSSRSITKLECLKVTYTLPWAVANIVRPETLHSYQQVFTLQLQIHRAKYLLDAQTLKHSTLLRKVAKPQIAHLVSFLRHRLRWYVDTLQVYFATMLPLAHDKMREAFDAAKDIDSMINVHENFMQQLDVRALSASRFSTVRQAITSLLELAVVFSDACATLASNEDEDATMDKLESLVRTYRRLISYVSSAVGAASRAEGDEYLRMLSVDLGFGIQSAKEHG